MKEGHLVDKIALAPVMVTVNSVKKRSNVDFPINAKLWEKVVPKYKRLGYTTRLKTRYDYSAGLKVVDKFTISHTDNNTGRKVTWSYEPMIDYIRTTHGTFNEYLPLLIRQLD